MSWECLPFADSTIHSLQCSDYSDAITYAQSLPNVDASKIAIWGSSYSGGHVLAVGAVDRRVKCVLSQVPCVDGWANFHRLIRPDFVGGLNQMFEAGTLPPHTRASPRKEEGDLNQRLKWKRPPGPSRR
jgi:hypothetical protein